MLRDGIREMAVKKVSQIPMSESKPDLSRLSFDALNDLLEQSSVLQGHQVEAFTEALRESPLYNSEIRLQLVHSRAILQRMTETYDFEEALILSHVQESVPSFFHSLTLRQLFARGLVAAAAKQPTPPVLRRALNRLVVVPSFTSCPVLQQCAGELFLEAVSCAETASEATKLVEQMKQLPGMAFSSELREMAERAADIASRTGRDPIVKVDLNQKIFRPLGLVGRLFGMRDFRMKVELHGLTQYEQAVLRVPAFNEKAARKAANRFVAEFLRTQEGREQRSARITDVFPPGSAWESGLHPVLKLS